MKFKVGDRVVFRIHGYHTRTEVVVSELEPYDGWAYEVTDDLGTEWWAQADELSEPIEVGTFPFLNPGAGRV